VRIPQDGIIHNQIIYNVSLTRMPEGAQDEKYFQD
jgi:hypothetical protein